MTLKDVNTYVNLRLTLELLRLVLSPSIKVFNVRTGTFNTTLKAEMTGVDNLSLALLWNLRNLVAIKEHDCIDFWRKYDFLRTYSFSSWILYKFNANIRFVHICSFRNFSPCILPRFCYSRLVTHDCNRVKRRINHSLPRSISKNKTIFCYYRFRHLFPETICLNDHGIRLTHQAPTVNVSSINYNIYYMQYIFEIDIYNIQSICVFIYLYINWIFIYLLYLSIFIVSRVIFYTL